METVAIETTQKRPAASWHALPGREVLRLQATSEEGLSDNEAQARLQTFGKNVLPGKKAVTLLQIILNQFLSPFIYILLGAMGISIVTGDYTDGGFIGFVILINVALGAYQEWRSEKSAKALQQLLQATVRVKRAHSERILSTEELVPGDIVLLESGNKVPADLRLIYSNNLTIDEAFLTGESVPVVKQDIPIMGEKVPLAEQHNIAFAGSTVVNGRGTGVVIATASHTEVGKLSEAVISSKEAKTPLVVRMERFAQQVSYVVIIACILLVGISFLQGQNIRDMFFVVVALAVAAIPEGLPISMTVALSISINRMIRRNVIVRKLTAVEGLGSCTAIATDKTGTLTVNEQTVKRVMLPDGTECHVSGEGYEGVGRITHERGENIPGSTYEQVQELAKAAVLCNEGQLYPEAGQWKHLGDSVDIALLALGSKPALTTATCIHRWIYWSKFPLNRSECIRPPFTAKRVR